MQHGRHPATRSRQGLRAGLAVFWLLLALPAHAGWLDRVFGSPAEKASAGPVPVTGADPSRGDETTTITSDVPGNDSEDPGVVAGGPADAQDNGVDDSKDNTVVLPNVEESALTEDDELLESFSKQDLATKGDLWERVRKGFKLDASLDNDRIAIQRNWYMQRQDYLDRTAIRATRYLYYTINEAEKRGLPTELALLPVIESAYDPFAYSHASAAGMWQFIPGTAKIMGVKQNWWFDGRRDVLESTRAAYDFLSMLYAKFGDWQLVLAAYNAGPGTIQRAIEKNQARGLPTDFWSLHLPAETMSYVPRFIAITQIINTPETYGVTLRPVVNQPFFRVVNTSGQVDLNAAAQIAGVSLKELYQLNPGFNRWATDPDGPHRILVPASLPEDFESQLTALPAPAQSVSKTYKVRKGDTIFRIAKQFGTSPAELKRLNNLKSNNVPVGRTLTVTQANVSAEFLALSREIHLNELADGSSGNGKISRHYKVHRGDTLASIARRHGVSVKDLARWNGMGPRSRVHAGQRLTIQMTQHPARRVASGRIKGGDKVTRIHYQVRKGDTLASIGKRYNVSVKEIRRWNGARKLHPGQGIVLFVAANTRNRNL